MAQAARLNLRMQKELKLLLADPPPGASFPALSSPSSSSSYGPSLSYIEAQIEGPEGTVYANGYFKLKVQIPDRYPFQPPIVTFATPIYHPNIDNGGRICLDILNLPPKGAWQPSLNISTVLTSIGLLLSEPNPDDGLMREASQEYKYNRQVFDQKARSMTEKYARIGACEIASGGQDSQTILNPSVDFAETKGADPLMQEVNKLLVSNKRFCGISRKLSLETSELDRGRGVELKRLKQNGMPIEQNQSQKDPERMSKELLLEPLVSFNVKKDNDINDLVDTKGKSTSRTEVSTFSKVQHEANNCDERSKSKSLSKKLEKDELILYSEKEMMNDQEKLLSVALQSSTQCHSSGSLENCPLAHTDSYLRREPWRGTVDGDGSGVVRIKHKKLGLAGRRFSSGMFLSDQRQEKADRENLVPISSYLLASSKKNLSPPSSSLPESEAIQCHDRSILNNSTCLEQSEPLRPLSQLSNTNTVNTQSEMESLNPSKISTAQPKEKLQAEKDCLEKFAAGIKNQEATSPSIDMDKVVVLDSEDSDEDQSRITRSKLSLVRRRFPRKLKS